MLKRSVKLFLLLLIPIFAGSFGYYLMFGKLFGGQESFLNCLYMTVITVSSTGFGEMVDMSSNLTWGRVYTMLVLVCGMGTMVYAVTEFTAALVEGTYHNAWRRKKMEKKILNLNDHIIVCGYGETGVSVVQELYKTKRAFVIVEHTEEIIEEIESFNQENPIPLLYIKGDAADEHILLKAGIEKASGLIAALREDKDNLFVTITARGLNSNIRIVVRVAHLGHRKKFINAGANSVVSPNFIGGMRLVSEMIRPHAVTFMDSMLGRNGAVMRVEDHILREGTPLEGKTLREADLQKRTGCLVMAMKEPDSKDFLYIPDRDVKLKPGDVLVVLGEVESIRKLKEL
ncbi:MAG: potassium channel protein [Candidatus Wallbacteria bacterium]|nr:potassium channel protein [Candidatus Wallbacteria bacterium]